jgi:E1A/CREB-binding protein
MLQEIKCPVPFCSNIKQKLKQQQMQQRLAQAQLIRRRMAMTTQNSRGAMSTPTGGKPAVMGLGHQPQGQQPAIMGIPSHQQGIGMKPGTQVPPANVLQVVKQVDDQFNSKVFIFYFDFFGSLHK